jgi:hypothetical protein
MVRESNNMSIFIHLCACDGFVDIVKNYLNIHLATVIERESNCNITSSIEEYPFLHMDITPRELAGWDLKITIPVHVNSRAILKENYGCFYHIVKRVYREAWMANYIKKQIDGLMRDCFYSNDFVAFTSTSIKEVRVTKT